MTAPRTLYPIAIGLVAGCLIIGGVTLGNASRQGCLVRHAERDARAQQAQSRIGQEQRDVDARANAVDASDRVSIIANQQVTANTITALAKNGRLSGDELDAFTATNKAGLEHFQKDQKERNLIAAERARIDRERATAPAPDDSANC